MVYFSSPSFKANGSNKPTTIIRSSGRCMFESSWDTRGMRLVVLIRDSKLNLKTKSDVMKNRAYRDSNSPFCDVTILPIVLHVYSYSFLHLEDKQFLFCFILD